MYEEQMKKKQIIVGIIVVFLSINFSGCTINDNKNREEAIPDDAVKMTPETDSYPPQLHCDEYEEPVPMPGPINTAGSEDSPFLPCCERRILFFLYA